MTNSAALNDHTSSLSEGRDDESQPLRFRRTIMICAALVAGGGFVALAGWMLGQSAWSSLGSGNIPMAPSTALLFVLSAVALLLRVSRAQGRARIVSCLIGAAVALTATLLLILSAQGIYSDFENFGFTIAAYAGTTPLGHMSPITAFCFQLVALSYLASHSAVSLRPWRFALAGLLVFLLMLANYLFVLGYLYGEPFFYGGALIPPALPTCLAFLILGIALLALIAQHDRLFRYLTASESRTTHVFILMFTILATGIVVAGFLYFRSFEKSYRAGVENQLSSIGDLKAGELKQWRKDRLEHGAITYRTEFISALVRRAYQAGADQDARRLLKDLLAAYRNSLRYDEVRLLDTAGATLMSFPENQPAVSAELRKRVADVFQSQQVTLVDFYRDDHDRKVYLSMLVPVRDDLNDTKVIGIIALRINPETYLYPLIELWPVPSSSSETLLIRRDGTDALYLNAIKFNADSALKLRVNMEKRDVPAIKAILGQKGIVEGRDYRGVPVIAYVRPIPDSPWFLVSKTDRAELYAPLRERLWLIIFFVTVVLVGAGMGMGLTWRQQRVSFYKEKFLTVEALRESEERFRRAIEESPFPIMIHADDGTVLSLSRAWTDISGYGMSDIPTINEWTLKAYGAVREPVEAEIKSLYFLDHRVPEGEFAIICKDGSLRIWDFSSMSIGRMPDGRRMAISMAADVTERKEKEKELARKNAELERYSYTVSHDLKSPLITIRSFSGAIRRDLETGRQDRLAGDLGRIEAASAKMAELLDDLLELSRVGHQIQTTELVALNDLVSDVLTNLAGPLEEHKVKVAVQHDLPTVLCDRKRMAEVIQNLLENAIKYRGEQENPQILFGMRQDHGITIYFVQDNGMGIDPKYHENVFGLFNKLNARSDGSGIGLALVKRIIGLHGGTVWVESRGIGFGTTFCFTLADTTIA